MVSGAWICVDCSADHSAAAGFVHWEDSVWDRRAAGRLSHRGGGTRGAVPVRSLFRSPGEQPPATMRGLAPFLPVFKTGYGGEAPAWKVRFLRRVVRRRFVSVPGRLRGKSASPRAELTELERGPWLDRIPALQRASELRRNRSRRRRDCLCLQAAARPCHQRSRRQPLRAKSGNLGMPDHAPRSFRKFVEREVSFLAGRGSFCRTKDKRDRPSIGASRPRASTYAALRRTTVRGSVSASPLVATSATLAKCGPTPAFVFARVWALVDVAPGG